MQRLLTAAVGTFVALASLFLMPAWGWFLVVAVVIDWAAFEYLQIVRPLAPKAPVASLSLLGVIVPWLVFLLMAIVWLGDSAAYYVGRRFGRHKMAPVVSPQKSWEGAAASFAIALLAAGVWSWFRLHRIDPGIQV